MTELDQLILAYVYAQADNRTSFNDNRLAAAKQRLLRAISENLLEMSPHPGLGNAVRIGKLTTLRDAVIDMRFDSPPPVHPQAENWTAASDLGPTSKLHYRIQDILDRAGVPVSENIVDRIENLAKVKVRLRSVEQDVPQWAEELNKLAGTNKQLQERATTMAERLQDLAVSPWARFRAGKTLLKAVAVIEHLQQAVHDYSSTLAITSETLLNWTYNDGLPRPD